MFVQSYLNPHQAYSPTIASASVRFEKFCYLVLAKTPVQGMLHIVSIVVSESVVVK